MLYVTLVTIYIAASIYVNHYKDESIREFDT